MTKEYLDKKGYNYQFSRKKWTKRQLETMKRWHYWGEFVGQFLIDGYCYKVFTV